MKKEWMYFIAGAGLAVAIMSATILIQGDNYSDYGDNYYSDYDKCVIKEAEKVRADLRAKGRIVEGSSYRSKCFNSKQIIQAPSLDTACDTVMPENLNNFSITDTDMQTILDDLAVDMDQILAELNFDDEGFSD